MILDVMLPGLSGYRVVRALRAEENWVPVLMLSAKDGEYDQADGLDCGADDYLTKPFSYVVLLARLRALLRRGAPARPAVLTLRRPEPGPGPPAGDRGGDEVALTTREFALLEYLMRRAGEVVSKTELLDHVWDAGGGDRPQRGRGLRRLPAPQARPRIGWRRSAAPATGWCRGAGRRLSRCAGSGGCGLRLRARLCSSAGGVAVGLLVGGLSWSARSGSRCSAPSTTRPGGPPRTSPR